MIQKFEQEFIKLKVIAGIKRRDIRSTLIKELSKDDAFCSAVRIIIKNLVNGKIRLSPKEKKGLRPHERLLLKIAAKKNSKKKKRRLINQKGMGFVLPLVVPLVAQLLSSLTSK